MITCHVVSVDCLARSANVLKELYILLTFFIYSYFLLFACVADYQVMKASFWCFLEVILVGSLMLYATASLHDNLLSVI